MNSTTYDDSFLNKSKFTNLSTNISHEEEITRNRFPNVTQYSNSNWKTNSVYRPKFNNPSRKQNDSENQGISNGITLNQIFKNNIIVNQNMVKNEDLSGVRNNRRELRMTNKSVHWNSNNPSRILLEDGKNNSHLKRKSM